MQKGKHQVGQTQGYPPRNYSAYPGNPDNPRQYIREVSAFHAGGTPGGGPGMRGMHHAPPNQPPTPPTSQDIKQPPGHIPPQPHQMPPQSGGQIMQYSLPGTGRGNTQQTPFYPPSRAPLGSQRMAHARPSMVMSNSAQSFMSQQVVQPVYQGHVLSAQMPGQGGPVFVSPSMSQPFQIQQPRHQSGSFYSSPQILLPQHTMYPPYPQQMYYTPSIQTMSRAGGPAPNSQGAASAQPQPPLTLMQGHGGAMLSQQTRPIRQKKLIEIIDPRDGRNVLNDINENDSSRSGESSARQTPQPNSGQKTDQGVAAEFATRVAIAARVDHSGSPNPPTLQKSSSRTSNYSENDCQASPDPQGMSTPSVSPSKLDTSAESISDESQIVENNVGYDGNQPGPMIRGSWTSVMTGPNMPVEILSMPLHPGMMISDTMPAQSNREYQAVQQQTQWMPEGNAIPPAQPIIMTEEPSAPQMESQIRPERITPVVSALGHAKTVEISPRSQREQFPVLGKSRNSEQQQSPVKRKQRSEPSYQQEQSEIKVKEQHSKGATQSKHKAATPSAESRKQQQQQHHHHHHHQQQQPVQQIPPPSQDSDEYVQSAQTKISEPKTIIIKKNDVSDCSGTKTKSEDGSKAKENNVSDGNNANEENVQEANRIECENVKSDSSAPEDCSPATPTPPPPPPPPADPEPCGKIADDEGIENAAESDVAEPAESASSATAEESCQTSSKSNGDVAVAAATVDDEAKSNNQKPKPGSKRPAQSKMRLESRNAAAAASEPNAAAASAAAAAAIEGTPSTVPEKSSPSSSTISSVAGDRAEKVEVEEETPKAATPVTTTSATATGTATATATAADEENEKEKEDLLVATKNENNKQNSSNANEAQTPIAHATANKIVLKHNYENDQWSPLNPGGKKKYDRQFIMGFQNQPQSLKKLTNFPFLELLSDNKQRPFDRNVINSMNRSHVDNIYPSFANKNSSQRGQTIPKRGSQQGKPKAVKPTVVQVSLLQDVKLHETENAWKPTRITEPVNGTEEETETEALYKRVRGILNKLTPEKFNKLVSQVKELPIDNSKRLEGVIDLVFKKAVDEPSFSVAYAQMCRTLQKMEVPSDRKPGQPQLENFRKLLLNRCQQEFEKNGQDELKRDEKLKAIDDEKDSDKKKAMLLAFDEEERRIRMRSVGNIRFIGELYKLQMLTGKIMHKCIHQLLTQGDEESLECLCKLLTTIGQDLENQSKVKPNPEKPNEEKLPDLNEYFKKLNDIVKNKGSGKVSSRVRFMIQDLIDLKASKWVPRRNESQPKTIDQIQKEAERENIQINLALNAFLERNKRQDMRNSVDGRKRGAPDSSGWTTVTNSQPNKSRLVVESSKLKLDQSDVEVASTLSLGNRNQFMWGQGASSGKTEDKRSVSQLGTNKFAVLLAPSTGNSNFKGSSSIEKDRINSYKTLEDDVRSSKGKNQQLDQNSRSSSRESASSKRDSNNRFMSPASNKAKVAAVPAPVPSNESSGEIPEEVRKKSKLLLQDYLSCLDMNEALKDLNELFAPSIRKDFVNSICNDAMDTKGSQPKRAVGLLMNHFIACKSISKEQFFDGLSKVMEAADDLTLDAPYLWEYIAEILVEMCAQEVITLKEVASAMAPFKGSAGSAKFLSALVKFLLEKKDETWLKERWIDSQVSLTDIISEKDVGKFVKENNVEFMLRENVKSELSRMIARRDDFDDITAWVSKNVGNEESSEPHFVRTLMTVLLEAAVSKGQSSSYKLDTDLFASYEQLILRYTNHTEQLELPCLFAIQAFVHKLEYPPSILHNIFEYLWDASLIATESFKSWRDSKNPQEQEGHAVCVTSLTSFFTHLNEPETDDES